MTRFGGDTQEIADAAIKNHLQSEPGPFIAAVAKTFARVVVGVGTAVVLLLVFYVAVAVTHDLLRLGRVFWDHS